MESWLHFRSDRDCQSIHLTGVAIPLGLFAQTVSDKYSSEKYTFVRAMLGDTQINGVWYDEDKGVYYVTTENDEITGTVVDQNSKIVLHYAHDKRNVKYQVYLKKDNNTTPLTDEQISQYLDIVGGHTAYTSQAYAFSLYPALGYTIDNVSYQYAQETPKSLSPQEKDANDKTLAWNYSVDPVKEKGNASDDTLIINVTLSKQDNKILFSGSNTQYSFNKSTGGLQKSGTTTTYNYASAGTGNVGGVVSYPDSAEITFGLYAWREWSDIETKVLNTLAITIGPEIGQETRGEEMNNAGGTKYHIRIPDSLGGQETTLLDNGITVTVKELSARKTDSNARSKGKVTAPEYEVTIKASDGRKIKGPIVVETNYKDTDASEVFAVRLDAVEPVSYLCWRADWEPRWVALANSWYYPSDNEYHWTAIASERNNQVESYMSPENYSYFSRSHWGKTNKKSFYFLKLLEGFSDADFDDLYLEVRNYDENTNRLDDAIGKNRNPLSFNELIQAGTLKKTSGLTGNNTNNKLKNLTGTMDNRELTKGDKDKLLASDYYFELPGSTTLKDTRIYVIYDPGTFRVQYDCDGGAFAESGKPGELVDGRTDLYLSPAVYGYGDSYVVTEQTPVKEGYTFAGWELVKEEMPALSYLPGTHFTIDKSNMSYTEKTGEKEFTYTYKALWEKNTPSTGYEVEVYFEQPYEREEKNLPKYPDAANYAKSETGAAGEVIHIHVPLYGI